jgi:rhodanese-related sulfurtransferase
MTTPTATKIDVREYPEFAAGHIEGSRLVPLAQLEQACAAWKKDEPLTLICKSGRRAELARQQLAAQGFRSLRVLEGGVDAWRAAGNPLLFLDRRPWSMERQVRTAAGSLILLTLALGYGVSMYFLFATAFIGAGLLFAGVSDTCMMASLLARLPWNRPARVAA